MHAHMWGWGSHQSLALDYLCVSWACLVSQLLHKDGCSAWVVPGIWLYHLSTSKPPDTKTFGAGWDLLVLTAAHALRLQRDSALQPLCYLADKPMTLFVGESSLELASNSAPLCTPTCCAHSGQGSPVRGTADKWAPVIRGCLLHVRACMCTQNRAPLHPGIQKWCLWRRLMIRFATQPVLRTACLCVTEPSSFCVFILTSLQLALMLCFPYLWSFPWSFPAPYCSLFGTTPECSSSGSAAFVLCKQQGSLSCLSFLL